MDPPQQPASGQQQQPGHPLQNIGQQQPIFWQQLPQNTGQQQPVFWQQLPQNAGQQQPVLGQHYTYAPPPPNMYQPYPYMYSYPGFPPPAYPPQPYPPMAYPPQPYYIPPMAYPTMVYPPVVSHNSQQAQDRIRRKQSATAKAKAAIANPDKPPNRKERAMMQKAAEEEAARATTTPANGTVPTPANEIAKATSVPTNETVKASSAAACNEIAHTFGTAPKFKPAAAQTASKLESSGQPDSSATAPLPSTNAQKTDVVPPDPLRKNESTMPTATRRQVSMQFIEPTYSRARESDFPSTPRSMDYLTRPRYVRPSFPRPDLWADSPQQRAESELAERISASQRAEPTVTVARTPTPATKVAAHQSDAQHVFPNRSWAIQSPASVTKEADQQGDAEYVYPPLGFGRDPDQRPAPAVLKTAPQSEAQQLGIDKTPAKRKRSDVVQSLHGIPTAKTSEHKAERAKRLRVTDSSAQSEVSRHDESVVDSDSELESDREL